MNGKKRIMIFGPKDQGRVFLAQGTAVRLCYR